MVSSGARGWKLHFPCTEVGRLQVHLNDELANEQSVPNPLLIGDPHDPSPKYIYIYQGMPGREQGMCENIGINWQ